jgi:acyl carrier protein
MATIDDVKRLLKETLQLGDTADGFDASTRLLGSLPELDSLAVVTVITAFDISVEDDEISSATFTSVGTLCDFVDQKLAT